MWRSKARVSKCIFALAVCASVTHGRELLARSAELTRSTEITSNPANSAALNVPRIAYTDSAFGVGVPTLGAAGFGEFRGTARDGSAPRTGGGVRIWGSPIDRLLLTMDAQRRESDGQFAPALSVQARILGDQINGWALGILGRYKAEGFANLSGELETGILFSLGRRRFHIDLNAIVGEDFDGGESDGELLARGGYDVLPFLRLGIEGRGRDRLTGKLDLPGDRSWDAFAGAQVFAFAGHYFAAVTGGPSTVGMSEGVGWSVIASGGGVTF